MEVINVAGIGFELKKVFKKYTLISVIKSLSSATFIAAGPMLISILLIIIIDKILIESSIPMEQRETIKATIMYAYVFSLINASGFIMIISRFVSDKLFIKDTSEVLSSLMGVIAITLIIGGISVSIFYAKSPIPTLQKFISYLLFSELSILYVLMAYISALKDYKKIALSFTIGSMLSIILSIIARFRGGDIITWILISVIVGYFINIMILLHVVKKHFGIISKNSFSFLPYLKKHYKLFLINLFYAIGMFIHNIIFWRFSNLSLNIMDTYYYAQAYDTASFFAILTIIPAAIIFVVKFETSFYERYKMFRDSIVEGGSLKDLITAKERMIHTLKQEFTFIMEVQLITTIVLVILGVYIILPIFANDNKAIELYVFLSIGFFMSFMTFIVIIVLLYFDLQKESLVISSLFLGTTILFTFLSTFLGEEFYGLGYNVSSLLSLIVSLYYLNKEMAIIDYRIYSG